MVRHRPKPRNLLAMIVGRNGQTSERRFSKRHSAIEWLEGEGAAAFEGKIERLELYDGRATLIWVRPLDYNPPASGW
jgi:hypothetical protein